MYEVEVTRTLTETKTIQVWASSDDEASSKAVDKAAEEDWDDDDAEEEFSFGEVNLILQEDDEDDSLEMEEDRLEREANSDDVRNREFGGMDW